MKATVVAIIAMVLMAFLVMPVMAANADNGLYTSKYAATSPDFAKFGRMEGALRSHENLMGASINMTEVATGIVTVIKISPDGTFEANDLTPGQYIVTLADGNGGQPESSEFTAVAGVTSTLVKQLLGHAVSQDVAPVAVDTITVQSATYGMQKVVIDQAYVPAVPGVPAVTHQDYEAGHVHAKKVGGFSQHNFFYNGHKYQIVGNQAEAAFMVHGYFTSHPAQMVTIIDVPAIPAIPAIPEVSHVEGAYVDVKAQVQAAINLGAREFVFNNAMNPGGIVNVGQTAVIVAIADPAFGQVKSVVINVTINGVAKTINAMEYQTIII